MSGPVAVGGATALEPLERAAPYKPLDLGNGRVAASVTPDGRLLGASAPHPRLGAVTLGGAAPFPDDLRRDAAAVRAYRAALAAPDAPGFGLAPPGGWTVEAVALGDGLVTSARLRAGSTRAEVVTWAPRAQAGEAGLVQRWVLRGPGDTTGWAWRGRLWLGRAALTQLTEGGVLPPEAGTVEADFTGGTLTLRAPGVAAALTGLPPGRPFRRSGRGPLALTVPVAGEASATAATDPGGDRRPLTVAWAFGRDSDDARRRAERLLAGAGRQWPEAEVRYWHGVSLRASEGVPAEARPLVRRAITYASGCCAWRVGDALCLVTDHQILPLAWTRDAYYATQALLARPGPDALDTVARHLRWLFQVAERPHGRWARAYLPNGSSKDAAFQLDQQCYPLLELVDYLDAGGDEALARDVAGEVRAVLDTHLAARHAGSCLVATDETPGDDPVPLPYHFSSHVLLWRTLRRLAGRARVLGLDAAGLRRRAERLRREARERFAVDHAGARLFAYAVDGEGGSVCLHDANDLPTVLAPLWGFCGAGDEMWRATMAFAFSSANPAWFAGRFGGLGSAHTPAPWPLGDVQELVFARLTGDAGRAARTLARLSASACWDGALPEAREPGSAAVRSRHWFAWPGVALAAALTHPGWQPGAPQPSSGT